MTTTITSLSEPALLALPEKVLQFGTGVLLRGLPDYLIDRANRRGLFNGRIVAVKSTDAGDPALFDQQGNLYTLCVRGIENGRTVSENILCTAISRVLPAGSRWQEVLACAANPHLELVISNTTEVGIQLTLEDIGQSPPQSFPGKLLAFLLARFRAFQGDPAKGLVIIPTELLPENGARLRAICIELAHFNQTEPGFIEWLETSCTFCNSLVDRIVPGKPGPAMAAALQTELGYSDELLIVAEPYCLWAIEGDERVREVLSFRLADPEAVIVTPDIGRYRERKLRLLNATHTLSCGLAHLAGFTTVSAAMADPAMAKFIETLLFGEIAPAIPYVLPPGDAEQFGRQVLDRFRNPFVEHRWLGITVQNSAKMRMRAVPVLLEHYRNSSEVPVCFALGFAAFLCFYRQPAYPVQDDRANYFFEQWEKHPPEALAGAVLSDERFWGANLAALPGFEERVRTFLLEILKNGATGVVNGL